MQGTQRGPGNPMAKDRSRNINNNKNADSNAVLPWGMSHELMQEIGRRYVPPNPNKDNLEK